MARGERIVEKLKEGSVAACWNRQQERSGLPDRCIQPMDRLVSVNGKSAHEEIRVELSNQEVVLEFQRIQTCSDLGGMQKVGF